MRQLDLTKTQDAHTLLRHAERMAAGGLEESARISATHAVTKILEALGVGERGRAVAVALVTDAASHGVSEYDLAQQELSEAS